MQVVVSDIPMAIIARCFSSFFMADCCFWVVCCNTIVWRGMFMVGRKMNSVVYVFFLIAGFC